MQQHYCYILSNPYGVTYNGYTNNLQRRLRQHNGEISGGAKSTQNKGPWHYIAIITSKDPQYTKNKALSLEWHIRYPTNKKPRPSQYKGPQGRLDALVLVFAHQYFVDIPFVMYVLPKYNTMGMSSTNSNVEVVQSEDVRDIQKIFEEIKEE